MASFVNTAQRFVRGWRRAGCWLLILAVGLALSACHRKTPEEMLREGYDLFRNRDILGAEMKYEKVLEKNPTGQLAVLARMGLANCYMADSEFDRAREQLDLVVKEMGYQNPDVVQILGQKASTYFMEKKPEQAIAFAEKTSGTLHGAPELTRQQYQLLLSEVYSAAGKQDKVIETSRRIIREWPNESELHIVALEREVLIYAEKKDYAKAIEVYQEYLKEHPKTPLMAELLFGIGSYQKLIGQMDKATASFDASEAEIRKSIETAVGAEAKGNLMLKLARVQQGRGNTGAARETLQKAIKDFPNSEVQVRAKFMLADVAVAEKKNPEAIGILQEIMKAYPDTQVYYSAMQRIQEINQPTTATMARVPGTTETLSLAPGTSATLAAPGATLTTPTLPLQDLVQTTVPAVAVTPAAAAAKPEAAPTSPTAGAAKP